MQLDWIEGLGLVAGAVGAFAFAPQAVKLVRTGDGAAVSGLTYTMVLVGALMWMTYGAFREAPSIVLWNLVAAGLAATVLGLKLASYSAPSTRKKRDGEHRKNSKE